MSIRFAQFCDDIRQEANGKWLLVGCYGDNMILSSMPYSGKLACFLTLSIPKGTTAVFADYSLASGATIARMEIEVVELPDNISETAQIPFPPIQINVSSPDELVLKIGFARDQVEEVGRLAITVGAQPNLNSAAAKSG